ncbi:NAD-binding protein [Gautieria morchelliformis]|nr:NAD-binding protein [Gautieria morchelliformis]
MSQTKVVLVTGCSEGGIGFSLCQAFAERGCIVYATARSVKSMQGFQHEAIKQLALDVTNEEQVVSVVKTIVANEGRIDVVINNAGVLTPGPLMDCTADQLKAEYDVNVFGIHRVCRAVVPYMAARREGVIVNVGSVVGEYATPWMGTYDSSKGAVRILTEVLAMECKPFNISVMLLATSSIQSKFIDKQDQYQLPPDSIYTSYAHNVRGRLEAGRSSSAMPSDTFAAEVASKVLSKTPPSYLRIGGKAWLFSLFDFLPRSLVLSLLWNTFSKPEGAKCYIPVPLKVIVLIAILSHHN